MKRSYFLILMLISLVSCGSIGSVREIRQDVTAPIVGCLKSEVEVLYVAEKKTGKKIPDDTSLSVITEDDNKSWYAKCKGKTYLCGVVTSGGGAAYKCTEEK